MKNEILELFTCKNGNQVRLIKYINNTFLRTFCIEVKCPNSKWVHLKYYRDISKHIQYKKFHETCRALEHVELTTIS
jgi:hypothetical protein